MKYQNEQFGQERALYGIRGAQILDCRFDGPEDGESALKESVDIKAERCLFNLRYPFWHSEKAVIRDCSMTEKCRAPLWYGNNIRLENCRIDGVKALRETRNISLSDCRIRSAEFAWRCGGIRLTDCELEGEYPFFECSSLYISGLKLSGKYSLQYTENAVISNSELNTKDALWHSKNVTVTDSVIKGEYLGWYAENLKLVRCRIIGTQPLCYCKNLILEDCVMEQCDLAFERSEIYAAVRGGIDSVKNPLRGRIYADSIDEIIMEQEFADPAATEIICSSALKMTANA